MKRMIKISACLIIISIAILFGIRIEKHFHKNYITREIFESIDYIYQYEDLLREKEFQIGKYKVWLTHGHNYYVSMSNENIKREARMRGVDIVMYGHTHKPVVDMDGDVIAVNPGSLAYPRQEGRKPSYIIMDIDGNGKAHFTINYLQ